VADRWFLKIDGIEGESTHVDHKNEIDVLSWSWGVTQSGSSSGGGGGSGKVSVADFHFVSRISKASPALFLACVSGSHLKSATLTGLRSAGKGEGPEFLNIKMDDVIISSFGPDGSEDDEPAQAVDVSFSKIKWTARPESSGGAPQPPVTAGWDVKLNKKI
jgi:type VI secretion system secreted protein Hcp